MSLAAHSRPLATLDPAAISPAKPARLLSLDVFRGLTIAAMILVNNGSDQSYAPLQHAEWHGWTPTDLVFPFFLFIVGVATPFSLAKRGGVSRGELLGHIWVRALALVLLGLLLSASGLPWPSANTPEGFTGTKTLRWAAFVASYAGLFFLLTPWPWKRVSTWLPVVVGVLLIALWLTMRVVRARAIAAGWPAETFGGGIFNPDFLRMPGVLQRIGLCYGVAATIALLAGWRTVFISAVLFCVAYVCLMFYVPVNGHRTGSLDVYDNFARTVDVAVFERWTTDAAGQPRLVQKHTYSRYPDNEGLVSTLPAVATTLLGILVGYWLRSPRTPAERCAGLLALAGPVVLLGLGLDVALMPINKVLWTPSYTIFTAGLAMLVLGTVFWLCDVVGWRAWAWPFKVFGMNAIAAFVAASLIFRASRYFPIADPRAGKAGESIGVVTLGGQWLREQLVQAGTYWPALATPENLSLAYALYVTLIVFVLMWVLYVCRVFVKV
jgi:predicted acyltransferase